MINQSQDDERSMGWMVGGHNLVMLTAVHGLDGCDTYWGL